MTLNNTGDVRDAVWKSASESATLDKLSTANLLQLETRSMRIASLCCCSRTRTLRSYYCVETSGVHELELVERVNDRVIHHRPQETLLAHNLDHRDVFTVPWQVLVEFWSE